VINLHGENIQLLATSDLERDKI